MGLILNVYRTSAFGDATNGGLSSRHNELCVVNVSGPVLPNEHFPAVLLQRHGKDLLRIVPAVERAGRWEAVPRWTMMGGNFAHTSDSRFAQECERLLGHYFYGAVAIHDRIE